MHRSIVSCTLAVLLMFCVDHANAQSAQARRDSLRALKETISEFKTRITIADSSGDAAEAARQRIMLAPLVKRAEALKLLEQAALIADTANLTDDEELLARKNLAELYRASGSWRRAYDEMSQVAALERVSAEEYAARQATGERSRNDHELLQRDSLITLGERRITAGEQREHQLEATAERWMFIAIGIGAFALVIVIVLLVWSGLRMKRFRGELKALRAEVDELKKPSNTFRPPVPEPIPTPPVVPVTVAPPVREFKLPADEMVAGMFKRTAPERLRTFNEARARGDHEKAVRVVHTLKPLLVGIDADHFTGLCGRLVAPGPADTAAWNADADALASAVEGLLAQR